MADPGLSSPAATGQVGPMDKLPPPIRLLVFMLAGWVNREQQAVIGYLREENAVLREPPDTLLGWYRKRVALVSG